MLIALEETPKPFAVIVMIQTVYMVPLRSPDIFSSVQCLSTTIAFVSLLSIGL